MESIKSELETKGYCILPNILSNEEVKLAIDMFRKWQNTIPYHNKIHNTIDPHGIYKFHEVGHQEHAWYIRTRPILINVYKYLWNTNELVVSFDGSCYISKNLTKIDNIWTHTDQCSNSDGLKCYQGFVALTSNKHRTLVVYEGSHKLHKQYFKDRNICNNSNWNKIDIDYLKSIKDKKRILDVKEGSLVLWDSRTFHQNQYGEPNSEERIVQYVCYLPKNSPNNNNNQTKKRKKYFEDRRTTSHWPYPIRVNGKQPQTYGDNSKLIDYDLLIKPNLNNYLEDIKKLI
tara:strand:+ start:116 stop:979 length:864 start_codon:yes stop_codon:yes gene_type:complete